jgi:hypothetical protein
VFVASGYPQALGLSAQFVPFDGVPVRAGDDGRAELDGPALALALADAAAWPAFERPLAVVSSSPARVLLDVAL